MILEKKTEEHSPIIAKNETDSSEEEEEDLSFDGSNANRFGNIKGTP